MVAAVGRRSHPADAGKGAGFDAVAGVQVVAVLVSDALVVGDAVGVAVDVVLVQDAVAVVVEVEEVEDAVAVDLKVPDVQHAVAVDVEVEAVGDAVAVHVRIVFVEDAVTVDVRAVSGVVGVGALDQLVEVVPAVVVAVDAQHGDDLRIHHDADAARGQRFDDTIEAPDKLAARRPICAYARLDRRIAASRPRHRIRQVGDQAAVIARREVGSIQKVSKAIIGRRRRGLAASIRVGGQVCPGRPVTTDQESESDYWRRPA